MQKLVVRREEKYEQFIEELKAILTEAIFTSRWALVEGYHTLGKRILKEGETVLRVAKSLDKSERTIQYAVQFAQKFPNLDKLPEGKNISWRKVIALLPEPKEKVEEECEHKWMCVKCKKMK
jgi:hypothetical protein